MSATATVTDYQHIQVHPLTANIGAEVHGVDLRCFDDDTFTELHDAWMQWKVLFFRDQHLSHAEHVAFGRRFGDLEIHPFLRNVAEHPEVIVFESTAENPNAAEAWHTDVTFRERPPMGSALRGRIIPDIGGDTLWANMELSYERLPDKVKEDIAGRSAVHSYTKVFARDASPSRRAEIAEEFPDVLHPIVRTHPVTGRKVLFISEPFTLRIDGVEPQQSERILALLYEQAKKPQHQCRFRWRPDSIALWDNRCTQHYAVPDFFPRHRQMERVTIVGDRPI